MISRSIVGRRGRSFALRAECFSSEPQVGGRFTGTLGDGVARSRVRSGTSEYGFMLRRCNGVGDDGPLVPLRCRLIRSAAHDYMIPQPATPRGSVTRVGATSTRVPAATHRSELARSSRSSLSQQNLAFQTVRVAEEHAEIGAEIVDCAIVGIRFHECQCAGFGSSSP